MKTINCKFLSETSGYKCIIDSLSLTNEPIAISTHHKSNKSNKNVKILHFTLCTFDEFPTNIHDIFPELMCLKIKNSKFPHGIKRENFAQLNNLIELSITNCDLKVLPEDLLNDLLELEKISFANNKIEEIGEKIFVNLFYLSFIDLRGNTNINIQYSATNASSTSLDDVKNAIKSMSLQKEKKFEILQEEIQKLTEENFALKRILKLQESLVEKQQCEIKNLLQKIENNSKNSKDKSLEFLIAAVNIETEEFVKTSVENLLDKIDKENALEILELGKKINNKQLQQKAFEIIQTKIFPDRILSSDLIKQTEKLKKLIDMKQKFEEEFENFSF